MKNGLATPPKQRPAHADAMMMREPNPTQTPPSPPKSLKRKAAEALIREKFRRQLSKDTPRQAVAVDPCSQCTCSCGPTALWCSEAVTLEPTDWRALQGRATQEQIQQRQQQGEHVLPGGLRAVVVSAAAELPAALASLRASMTDAIIAIDLEWRPQFVAGAPTKKVALMQLATSSACLLIRCCKMGFALPPPLLEFLRCMGAWVAHCYFVPQHATSWLQIVSCHFLP